MSTLYCPCTLANLFVHDINMIYTNYIRWNARRNIMWSNVAQPTTPSAISTGRLNLATVSHTWQIWIVNLLYTYSYYVRLQECVWLCLRYKNIWLTNSPSCLTAAVFRASQTSVLGSFWVSDSLTAAVESDRTTAHCRSEPAAWDILIKAGNWIHIGDCKRVVHDLLLEWAVGLTSLCEYYGDP